MYLPVMNPAAVDAPATVTEIIEDNKKLPPRAPDPLSMDTHRSN
jgi:hypothetical protein